MEIDENLQHQELTPAEKTAHITMRTAVMKEHGLIPEHTYPEVPDKSAPGKPAPSKRPAHRPVKNRVTNAVAKATGIHVDTLNSRLKAVEPDVGVIDLEADSPAELEAKARKLMDIAAKEKADKAKGKPKARTKADGKPRAVEVVPAGPRRETIKARCAEIWAPLMADIRRAYDGMPADHHGVFTQMAFTDMSLLKSEAEGEPSRDGKAKDEPSRAGKAEHEVTLKMATAINTKASSCQIQRAYEAHFGREMTGYCTTASRELIAAMGFRAAKAFILSQSKDPTI
jgi:hypothetical protein